MERGWQAEMRLPGKMLGPTRGQAQSCLGEGTVRWCCHLEGARHTTVNQDRPWAPFFLGPLQEPHCSSSSQEMGLEKTSLSNQRS